MKKDKWEKWEKTRAKGKSEFILKDGGIIFGLIGIGLILPIALAIFDFISSNFTFSFFNKNYQFRIIGGLISAFPAGCLWGWIMWEWMEWSYQRAKRKSE